jgi:hypothetical protein
MDLHVKPKCTNKSQPLKVMHFSPFKGHLLLIHSLLLQFRFGKL